MGAIVRCVVVALAVPLMTTPVWAQATPAGLQGFGIVLVLGDVQEGGTSDTVPPAARAALADLKDFLPYRSYRVLDTSWLLASATNRPTVTSRLQGPDDQSYEIELDRTSVAPSSLQIRFSMKEPAGGNKSREAELRAEIQQMVAARTALENQLRQPGSDPGTVNALRQRLMDAEMAIDKGRTEVRLSGATLIDTTFTMSLGETVVVGTSRMRGGNKALIVLLTAATRSGSKPRE
jgi:hypothetical protein